MNILFLSSEFIACPRSYGLGGGGTAVGGGPQW